MLRTNFKYENNQRAINKKLNKQEISFLCTALPLDVIYPPMKFHDPSWYSLEICSRQNSSMKKTKGNNSKIKQARVMIPVHCTPPYEIYQPMKFHNRS